MQQLETIYVVFKTHVDIGFTGLVREVLHHYETEMIDDVIKVCENTQKFGKDHQYVWTMPAWLLQHTLQNISENQRERVEQLIKQGQLVWHALPFTTHTEFCGVEEFIRGLHFSKQLADRYGKRTPISAKMTDVPGHTWMLPSILYKAGVRFLHLGCNSCSTPPDVPRLFYWEGPDGNRILTFYSKGGYGTDLLPPDDWPYPIWLALQQTHDNIGPQSDDIVENVLSELRQKAPGVKVKFGTMDDFAHDFLKRKMTDIPIIKKDLADTWIHGIGTYPQEVSDIRRLRTELSSLEALMSIEQLCNEHGNRHRKTAYTAIQKAYEHVLLFGEHTWGLDMKITLLPMRNGERVYEKDLFLQDKQSDSYKRAEASWDEQRSYVQRAEKAIRALRPSTSADDRFIGIYNPLPWTRHGEEVVLECGQNGFLADLENGERYPLVRDGKSQKAFVNRIPPAGWRVFKFVPGETAICSEAKELAKKTDTQVVLENRWITVRIDRRSGAIVSFYDKEREKEWVDDGASLEFGDYQYSVYGKEDILRFMKDYAYDLTDWYVHDFGKAGYPRIKRKVFGAKLKRIDIENRWNQCRVIITKEVARESYEAYGNAKTLHMILSLKTDQKGVDVQYRLCDKQETPFLEAGHFVFPLKTRRPQYCLQKMGSVIDPVTDILEQANQRLHCCDQWVDVQDGEHGIGFIPLDTPLLSIGEAGILQYSKTYVPEQSTLFFNAFNNQWGTNFPQWMGGDYTFKYRIVLHGGNWKKGNVWKAAAETRHSLTAVPVDPKLSESFSHGLLNRDVEGIAILAFKPSDDDGNYILRFQDLLGEKRFITLTFQNALRKASECDLLEREQGDLQRHLRNLDHSLITEIKPYEIKTLKLKFRRSKGEEES
ncbi:DUF5054 domain-containing protein [Novibacillus thermophilus]|uniref:Glycoside hydrolase family 38 N-terminal domain-containing protein n=1 Tax=Novibacillus thermophilus TaxID=1471761 RepID=A0A1U9K7Y9_9BACL|nr:DUF5054 domain-containing protein [Novibacillus thermophilus]AQS56177.1 hypothetical protein B0W44_10790 [Novibacillus thermophilus]